MFSGAWYFANVARFPARTQKNHARDNIANGRDSPSECVIIPRATHGLIALRAGSFFPLERAKRNGRYAGSSIAWAMAVPAHSFFPRPRGAKTPGQRHFLAHPKNAQQTLFSADQSLFSLLFVVEFAV